MIIYVEEYLQSRKNLCFPSIFFFAMGIHFLQNG